MVKHSYIKITNQKNQTILDKTNMIYKCRYINQLYRRSLFESRWINGIIKHESALKEK